MKAFYKNLGFIIGFMILLIFIQMAFGDKFLYKFLLLVLSSMILINSDKVIEYWNDNTNFKKVKEGD